MAAVETPEGVGEGAVAPKKNSDLKARTLAAIVMVAVAGLALWLGGLPWMVFVLLVATGVLWEWSKLSRAIAGSWWARLIWLAAGVVYVGLAAEMLITLRAINLLPVLITVCGVIATDVGAYFAGRTFGGPKIAPKISPSKTWSGLAGGMLAVGVPLAILFGLDDSSVAYDDLPSWIKASAGLFFGFGIAIIAQTGDFFESWMKRRAGVKDSGHLIPGHGGLFDRVDGLLAVLFVAGILGAIGRF